jgi:hypothetical protein
MSASSSRRYGGGRDDVDDDDDRGGRSKQSVPPYIPMSHGQIVCEVTSPYYPASQGVLALDMVAQPALVITGDDLNEFEEKHWELAVRFPEVRQAGRQACIQKDRLCGPFAWGFTRLRNSLTAPLVGPGLAARVMV